MDILRLRVSWRMWVLTTKAHFGVIIHRLATIYFQVLRN